MSNFSRTSLLLWLAILGRFGCISFALSASRMEKSFDMMTENYYKAVHMQEENCYDLLVNHKI